MAIEEENKVIEEKSDNEARIAQRKARREARENKTVDDSKDSKDHEENEEPKTPDELQKELKKLQRELRREQRANKSADKFEKEIKLQKAQLDTIIDTHMVYILVDKSLVITEASKAFSDLFGYGIEQSKGEDYKILIQHEDMEKFYNGCEYVASHGKEAWGTDIRMLSINNDTIHTHTFIYPMFTAGVLSGFTFVIEDISKEKLLHQFQRKVLSTEHFDKKTLDFVSGTSAAVLDTVSRKISTVVKVVVGFVFLFLIYASSVNIDEIARGQGQFIPTSKIKKIKNLEGGVVSHIYIKEGDTVRKNQILVKLSAISYKSKLEENRIKIMQLDAKEARLTAEVNNLPMQKIVYEGKYDENMIENQKHFYLSNQKELQKNVAKQMEQLRYQQSVLVDSQNKYDVLKENIVTLKEEYKAKKALEAKKIFTKYELDKLQRDLNDAKGKLKSALESIQQSKSKIQEIKNGIEESKLTFKNKAATQLNETRAESLKLKETNKNLEDIIRRTTVRSPIDGVVKEMFIHTIGSSVSPSSDIVSIVPDNHSVVAKVKIKPSQIAKLHVGQSVKLKVTAFDYSIYGALSGKIINISPDTILDKQARKSFYMVYVKTKKNYLLDNPKYKIKVGMMVNASIIVGKKSIMSFLLKPILKTTQRR